MTTGHDPLERTMKTTVVRYQAKPESAAENQQLIEAVFAELDKRQPDGFTYKIVAAPLAGALAGRFGARFVVVLSMALDAIGFAVLIAARSQRGASLPAD
jgi:hypothetical protein